MNKFCIYCGNPLPEGTRFCSKCGKPIEQQAPVAPAQAPYTPPQPVAPAQAPYIPPQPVAPAPAPYAPKMPVEQETYTPPMPVEPVVEAPIVEEPKVEFSVVEEPVVEETPVYNPYMAPVSDEVEKAPAVEAPQPVFNAEPVAVDTVDAPKAPKKKGKKIALIIVAIVLVIALAVGGVVGYMMYSSYAAESEAKAIVNDAITAISSDKDAQKAITYMNREYLINGAEEYDGSMEDLEEVLQEMIDDSIEDMNDTYQSWDFSWKITGVKEVTERKFEKLKDRYQDYDVEITSAKYVTVDFTCKTVDIYSESATNEYSEDIAVVEIDGKWYFDSEDVNDVIPRA